MTKRAHYGESIAVALKSNDPNTLMCAQVALALVALYQRCENEAIQHIKAAIVPFHKLNALDHVAECLSLAAGVAQARGELARAVRWLSLVVVIRRDWSRENAITLMTCYAEYEHCLPTLRKVVPPTEFKRAWAEGERMTVAQAVDEVLAMRESTIEERVNIR